MVGADIMAFLYVATSGISWRLGCKTVTENKIKHAFLAREEYKLFASEVIMILCADVSY